MAFSKERKIYCELILDLLTTTFEAHRPLLKDHLGASVETLLVGYAFFGSAIGGRSPSASRIARQLGMPHRTVLRKMDEMVNAGVFVRKGRGYRINEPMFAYSPEQEAFIRAIVASIHRASHKLRHFGATQKMTIL